MAGQLGEQRRLVCARVVVDDGCTEALKIRNVVEVVDQHVVFLYLPGRYRSYHDRIRILVAVVRHGGRQGDVFFHCFQEPPRFVRKCRQGEGDKCGGQERGYSLLPVIELSAHVWHPR